MVSRDEFKKMLDRRIALIRQVLDAKDVEYGTIENRHHNFYEAARILTAKPEAVLLFYFSKHLVSVMDMISNFDEIYPNEVIEEKIGDCINYLILLESLLKDRATREEN
jgi:hypothetical protein